MARTQSGSVLMVVRHCWKTPEAPDEPSNGVAGLSQHEPDTQQQRQRRLIDKAPCAGIDVGESGPFPQQERHTSDQEYDAETQQNEPILPQLERSPTVRLIPSRPYKDHLQITDIGAGRPGAKQIAEPVKKDVAVVFAKIALDVARAGRDRALDGR